MKKRKEKQKKIAEALYQFEDKITKELEGSKDKKKMYELIDMLRNKIKKDTKELQLYNEFGKKIPKADIEGIIKECWKNIYQMNENRMNEVWCEEISSEYVRAREEDRKIVEENDILTVEVSETGSYDIECAKGIREHLDMATKVEKKLMYMKYPEVTELGVKMNLKRLKKGKAAGPDGMKPEFYRLTTQYVLRL